MKPLTTLRRLPSLLILILFATLSACSQHSNNNTTDIKADKVAPSSVATEKEKAKGVELWPDLKAPATFNKDVETTVDGWLAKMTLAQKIGQMTQAEITWLKPKEVKTYHLGSALNGGGTFLNGKRDAGIDEWVSYMDAIYDASMDTSDGGLAIPVTYGIDAVHGNNKFGQATIFPHNIGLGATRNPELLRKIGEVTALEVLVTGIDWTFAPTLAVVRDDRWGRTYEGYSEDPRIVAQYAKEMVEGVQGVAGTDSFLNKHHVYATAKHWVGDGGTRNGVDQGDNKMTEEELMSLQAAAYFPALEAGVQSVMASHNSWSGKRMHGHKYLITDVLKKRLKFDGFVVGDWNAHQAVAGCSITSCAQAINAGVDMFMVVEDYKDFIANTINEVNEGLIPMARIDDAVRRILRVKVRSGLFEKGRPSSRPYSGKAELMGSEAHRDVARQAVRESLVLLKNNQKLLPLDRKQRVLVAGDGANNYGKQMGGWTISWQGDDITPKDFTGASTILDGIRSTVEAGQGTLDFNEKGEYSNKPDVAIVVFGENPYAEWYGDIKTISYNSSYPKDLALLNKLKSQGIPVVAVFLSGRALWVNPELNASDAFVAAWLPGSEGKAVADVLFKNNDGATHHDFKGKLSYSWPKSTTQLVLNVGDENYDPLFAYGYGLNYGDNVTLDQLSVIDDYKVEKDLNAPYPLLVGTFTAPWRLMLDTPAGIQYPDGSRTETPEVAAMEADKNVQGDAQEIRWSGTGKATVGITSQIAKDVYDYAKGAIQFDVRTVAEPQGEVRLGMGCSTGYCGNFVLNNDLPKAQSKEWKTLSVSMKCFSVKGVDFAALNTPFALTSEASAALRVANVKLTYNDSENQVSCE